MRAPPINRLSSVFNTLIGLQFIWLLAVGAVMSGRAQSPFQLVHVPESPTVLAGSDVYLAVAATGPGPLRITWSYRGSILTNQPNIEIFTGNTNSVLALRRVAPHQSGRYTVEVSNGTTTLVASGILTVLEGTPPVIVFQTYSNIVEVGSFTSLSLSVHGSPPMEFTWLFNGGPLTNSAGFILHAGMTNTVMHITNAAVHHSGFYTVRVRNSAGSTESAPMHLIVLAPSPERLPQMIRHPQSVVVQEGGNAVFSASARTTDGFLSYLWLRDGVSLGQFGPQLTLANVQLVQAGTYSVLVSNRVGMVESAPALLKVIPAPPSITQLSTNQQVETGAEGSFFVWVSGSRPLEFDWRKNGVRLQPGPDAQVFVRDDFSQEFNKPVQVATLVLPSVSTNSGGAYSLRVRNASGELTTPPMMLSVFAPRPPTILTLSSNSTAVAGTNVILFVRAAGTQPLWYQWQKSGSNLVNGPSMHDLNLYNVQQSEAGIYRVIITNALGSITSAPIVLNVVVTPPSIRRGPVSQTVSGGQALHLSVEIGGSPPFQFQWQHNGLDLPGQNSPNLYIPAAEAWHAGTYTVTVRNAAGTVTSAPADIRVNVLPPSIQRQPVNITVREGATAFFSAELRGSFPMQLQWQKDGNDLPGATNVELRLVNVRAPQAGSYALAITNSAGSARTLPARLTIEPARTNVGAVDISFLPPVEGGYVSAVIIQPDGKILAAGGLSLSGRFYAVLRFNPDGSVDSTFNSPEMPEGAVAMALQPDGKVLLGGSFHLPQHWVQYVLRLNSDGSIDNSFVPPPFVCCHVGAIAVQEDGKVLIGGETHIEAEPYSAGLRRLHADGSLDESFTSAPGFVQALAIQPDGKVIAMGSVSQPPALADSYQLVRFNLDGSWDSTFSPLNFNGLYQILLQPDGSLLVAGDFGDRLGPVPRGLGRWSSDGRRDTNFVAAFGPGAVRALALQPDGKILAGGYFQNVEGRNVTNLVRLLPNGRVDTSFDAGAGPNGNVSAIAISPDGSVVIGGEFGLVDTIHRAGIGKIIAEPGAPFAPRLRGLAPTATVMEGAALELYVWAEASPPATYQWQFNGGDLPGQTNAHLRLENISPSSGGVYRAIARNESGTVTSSEVTVSILPASTLPGEVDISFFPGTGANNTVYASVLQPDGKVIIGGAFTEFDGVPRRGLARLLPSGKLDESFDPGTGAVWEEAGAPAVVRAIALQADEKILVLGSFDGFSGVRVRGLVRLLPDGALDPSFSIGEGFDELYNLRALAVQPDGKVFVGGSFSTFNSSPRRGLIRLNPDGSADQSFLTTPFEWLNNINLITLLPEGNFYAGGDFGAPQQGIRGVARFLRSGELDTNFLADIEPGVSALEILPDGKVMVGGATRGFWAPPYDFLMRLQSNGVPDDSFAYSGSSGSINDLELLPDGRLMIARSRNYDSRSFAVPSLARVNSDGSRDECFEFPPSFPGQIHSITELPGNRVFAGGEFKSIDNVRRSGVAVIHAGEVPAAAPVLASNPLTQSVNEGTNLVLTVAPGCISPRPTFQWQFNGQNIPGATNRELRLSNVRAEDAGSYRFVARNAVGEAVTEAAVLTVNPGPTMEGAPDLNFYAGEEFFPPRKLALESDGEIVLIQDGTERLVRLRLDGTIDDSFQPEMLAGLADLAIQPDHKIVVVGLFTKVNGIPRARVARLHPDGTLDESFDPGPAVIGYPSAIVIQPDGRIVVGGQTSGPEGNFFRNFARYETNGVLDSSFLPQIRSLPEDLIVQPDGKILVLEGYVEPVSLRRELVRLLPDGSIDPEFHWAFDPTRSDVRKLLLQPDGKLLLGGNLWLPGTQTGVTMARCNSDGSLDPSFVRPAVPNPLSLWLVGRQGDGKILFTHYDSYQKLGRAGPDGVLDTGYFSLPIDGNPFFWEELPDGRSLIALGFHEVNFVPRRGLAILQGATSSRAFFDPIFLEDGRFEVSISTKSGEKYALEYKSSLSEPTWTRLVPFEGNGEVIRLQDRGPAANQRFYRVSRVADPPAP